MALLVMLLTANETGKCDGFVLVSGNGVVNGVGSRKEKWGREGKTM